MKIKNDINMMYELYSEQMEQAKYEVAILDGMNQKELAKKMGISEDEVKRQCLKMFGTSLVQKARELMLDSIK